MANPRVPPDFTHEQIQWLELTFGLVPLEPVESAAALNFQLGRASVVEEIKRVLNTRKMAAAAKKRD